MWWKHGSNKVWIIICLNWIQMAHFLKHQFWWNVEYKIILFHIIPLCLCNSRFGISWTILHVAACKGKSASTRNSACDCAEDLLTTRGSSCLVWWPQWTWSASWHPPQTTAVGHPSQHTRPHHRGHLHRGQPVGQEQISIPDVHVEQPVWCIRTSEINRTFM